MSTAAVTVLVLLILPLGTVLLSLLVEALRPRPTPPQKLAWAPGLEIRYVSIAGCRLRYIQTGAGPTLVLLHTLRTQLDLFQKVVPALAERFSVYALDYPGHGYSEIPDLDYEPRVFVEAVAGFLDALDVKQATLAGISIGGTIALLIASQHNPRVARVVAVNPYDYAKGTGIRRSSAVAWTIFGLAPLPVLGETVMRLRSFMIERKIFEGGVASAQALPPALAEELYAVGARRGHYQAFLSLLRKAAGWERARAEYPRISVPVLLIYGEHDWSTPAERQLTARAIPGVRVESVPGGNHFLSLDRPEVLIRLLGEFAGG